MSAQSSHTAHGHDGQAHGERATHGGDLAAGHDTHAGHSIDMFRRQFWGTLVLSIPTILWSPMIQHWFGYTAPGGATASRWVPAIFGTLVFAYGGRVFIRGAIGELRARLPGMMTLISLALSVAFLFSLAVTVGFPGSDLWWELATLVAIMVLGHWIEMRSITQAEGALKELAKLLPDTAVRIVGERTETIPVDKPPEPGAFFPLEERRSAASSSSSWNDDGSTFSGDSDPGAQAAALKAASESGAPFCEECAKAAKASGNQV